MSNFDVNAILRGAQLTLVGGKQISTAHAVAVLTLTAVNRALQNPGLFTSKHYRQAALAVAAGIAIRIIVAIPVRTRRRLTVIFVGWVRYDVFLADKYRLLVSEA